MVIIIDGANLAFRAYHVFQSLTNSKGEPTGMVFGFFSILNSYANQFGSKVIIAWEGGDNWRNELYPEYKAKRDAPGEDIKEGFQKIQYLCKLAGIIQIRKPKYEADDIISFLVRRIGSNIRIISGDKDLIQLIDSQKTIYLLRPRKDRNLEFYDEQTIRDELKIEKDDLVNYLAICGDKSDNIKGIRGWGPVKTSNLIRSERDPIKKIKEMYPHEAENIDRNLLLIDLKNRKTMLRNIEPGNVLWEDPDLLALNQQFHFLEIRNYNAKEIIDNLTNPIEQQKLYNLITKYEEFNY